MALFSLKILFWLPRLYHLIFLFWEERQKAPLGLLYKKSCSWEFRKIHRKTPVSEFLFSLFPSEVCNFIKERLRLRCFSVSSPKFKNSCLEEHLLTAVSEKIYNYRSITVKIYCQISSIFLWIFLRFKDSKELEGTSANNQFRLTLYIYFIYFFHLSQHILYDSGHYDNQTKKP